MDLKSPPLPKTHNNESEPPLEILIDDLEESLWVAAVEKNELIGLEIDPADEEVRWGSIYWAKIVRIDKAMDAAYVELDEDNYGLLHNTDTRIKDEKTGLYKKGGDAQIGKNFKAGDMIAVQAKSGYLVSEDEYEAAMEDKSAKVSMDITLPGRHLIFAPFINENKISSRIRDKKQRKQVRKMLNNLDGLEGFILRASALNTQTDVLIREAQIVKEIWEQLKNFFEGKDAQLIMLGPDAMQRTFGDHAAGTIDQIDIISMDQYQETEEWCEIYAPDLVTKIQPVELPDQNTELGLFDFHDIIGQVETLFNPYIILKNGGNIIVQQAAALCAIDVNRGQDTRSNLSINLEAVKEIGRQLRLRNIGGIIIVDFLKLKTKKEKDSLLEAMVDIVDLDPCTVQIHGLTNLNLMEITRKQRTPSLQDRLDIALK